MTDLAKRDPREVLSKSFMHTACGEKAWFTIHDPRPWVAPEKVTFGSAVDAGCSAYVAMARANDPASVDMDRAYAAAWDAIKDEPNKPEMSDVQQAVDAFAALPYDWAYSKIGMAAGTAKAFTMRFDLGPGIGMVDCHPDIVLRDHSIWDIKASKRAKPDDAAEKSIAELAFYGVCYEAYTGETVPMVGYLTWVRSKKPYWQQVYCDLSDEMRVKALANAKRWRAAIAASDPSINNTFPFGPKFGCADCQYHPALGGACEVSEPLKGEY